MSTPLRLTFRAKLLGIVGITGVAFVALVLAGAILGRRVEGELVTIQERYLPRVELAPELDGEFDHIRRAFQDAVAIRDVEGLAAADEAQ
jgi:hypothetical protein